MQPELRLSYRPEHVAGRPLLRVRRGAVRGALRGDPAAHARVRGVCRLALMDLNP